MNPTRFQRLTEGLSTSDLAVRVYVAAPLSKGNLDQNIHTATDAGMKLLKAGLAPLVPHLSCYMAGPVPSTVPGGTTHADWIRVCLPWVAAADHVLRLPGESVGADLEVKLAERLGIPVHHDIDKLILAVKEGK